MTADLMPCPVTILVLPPVPIEELRKVVRVQAGEWTLLDVANATQIPHDGIGISVNGRLVRREAWATTSPAPGDGVIVSTRPGVAAIFAFFAAQLGTGVVATVASVIATVATITAISYGLSALSNALLAPSRNDADASAPGVRRTIAGQTNAFDPYAPVPQVLGRHRFYPPLAARSYTTVEDGVLFQYALFTFGYGQLALSDLKIGDDPLFREGTTIAYTGSMKANTLAFGGRTNAAGVVLGGDVVELEIRAGTDSDAAITLFSANVQEQVVAKRLENEDSTDPPSPGPWTIHRTVERTRRISVIVGCPNGLVRITKSGDVKPVTVRVEVEYRLATSTETWTPATVRKTKTVIDTDPTTGRQTSRTVEYNAPLEITAQTRSSVFRTRAWEVTEGTYDVRMRRLSAEGGDPGQIDQTEWTSMLCHRSGDVIRVTGLCLVAAKMRITGHFSGLVNNFNAIAQTVIPDWDGAAWTTQATSNPASIYRHVLQGPANKRAVADSRISLPTLQAWHVECTSKGFEFNHVTQGRGTVIDALRQVAAAGRATPGQRDGLFGVVRENPLTGPAIQHFTPRNIISFEERRRYVTPPHAFKVQFVDPASGYLDTERIVPDDDHTETTATDFERLDMPGITSAEQAYKLGRYHLAVLRLRPSEYIIETDFEHLDCARGDLVHLAHDVIMVGLAHGRVVSVTLNGGGDCTGVVVDQQCPMAAATYGIRFRKSDGSTVTKVVTTAAGYQTTLVFTTPIASGDPMPAASDIFSFGEAGEEAIDLIVKEIEPLDDLAARLTLVDAAAGILTADSGTIPAYESHVTIAPAIAQAPLAKPRILSVTSTDVRDKSGRGPVIERGLRVRLQPGGPQVRP